MFAAVSLRPEVFRLNICHSQAVPSALWLKIWAVILPSLYASVIYADLSVPCGLVLLLGCELIPPAEGGRIGRRN